MVCLHSYTTVPSHLNFLLHKNIPYSPSQPNTSTEPCFPRATEPSNSTKHSSIQKGSVHCTVGAGNISSLLSAVFYNGSFAASERLIFFRLPLLGIYGYFTVLKFFIKPVALLLEDQRSESSSKRHNQTTLLFIVLIYKYSQLCKEVYLVKSIFRFTGAKM